MFLITMYIVIVSFSFADYPSCQTPIEELKFSLLQGSQANVRNMVGEFCRKTSEIKCIDNEDFFDANQSVFLTLLCDNVWESEKFTKIIRKWDDSILFKTWFTQFGIYDYVLSSSDSTSNLDKCDYVTSIMNWCNLAEQLPKMFNEIINVYFNVKQADIYWVDDFSSDFNPEIAANKFSSENFVWLKICDSESEYYKKSCKYLKNYMKDAMNLIKKSKIINLNKLIKVDCNEEFNDNLIYCWLLGDVSTNDSFLNLIYNEYMWYEVFMSYYSYNLSVEPNYSESKNDGSESRDKILLAKDQTFKIRQAITIALRSLSEMSSSFPIHIWFTMYQEDANMLMKKLSKIYSPIRTLYDKLRNVQEAE